MSSQEISWPVTWQRLIWIFLVSLLKEINCLHSMSVSGFIDWKSGSRKTTDPLEMQLISSEWTLRQFPEIALWLRRVDRHWRRHFQFYALVGRWEIKFPVPDRQVTNKIACSWQNSLVRRTKTQRANLANLFSNPLTCDFTWKPGFSNQIWSFSVGTFFFLQFPPSHFQAFYSKFRYELIKVISRLVHIIIDRRFQTFYKDYTFLIFLRILINLWRISFITKRTMACIPSCNTGLLITCQQCFPQEREMVDLSLILKFW